MSKQMDLLSDCCKADFDAFGFPREDGLYQEKCLKCGKSCEPVYQEVPLQQNQCVSGSSASSHSKAYVVSRPTQQKDAEWKEQIDFIRANFPDQETEKLAELVQQVETQARQQAFQECLEALVHDDTCTSTEYLTPSFKEDLCNCGYRKSRANIEKLMQKNGER